MNIRVSPRNSIILLFIKYPDTAGHAGGVGTGVGVGVGVGGGVGAVGIITLAQPDIGTSKSVLSEGQVKDFK